MSGKHRAPVLGPVPEYVGPTRLVLIVVALAFMLAEVFAIPTQSVRTAPTPVLTGQAWYDAHGTLVYGVDDPVCLNGLTSLIDGTCPPQIGVRK